MSIESRVADDIKIHKAGLNYKTCLYMMDNGSWCGASAVSTLQMPGTIPDMPLCGTHAKEFTEWDLSDTEQIVLEWMEELDD